MDPQANIERQRQVAAEIIEQVKAGGVFEGAALELAELVQALDEWRLKGGFDPYSPKTDIYDLTSAVRHHPDFAFGTIFTCEDFPNGMPDDFNGRVIEDLMTERGNEYIDDYYGGDA